VEADMAGELRNPDGEKKTNEQERTRLEQIALIVQVITSVSLVAGMLAGALTVYGTLKQVDVALQGARLSTFAALKEFINDDGNIQVQAIHFLNSKYNDPQKLHEIIKSKKSGKNAYYSRELKDLREVAHHYEVLGTLVRKDFINFQLVFDTIPFPDEFYKATSAFRKELQTENWSDGKGMPDFLEDTEDLKRRYDCERLLRSVKVAGFACPR
jgi:hypothetical protein